MEKEKLDPALIQQLHRRDDFHEPTIYDRVQQFRFFQHTEDAEFEIVDNPHVGKTVTVTIKKENYNG